MEEVICFLDKIVVLDGKFFDFNEYIYVSVLNVMCFIVFGKCYEYFDVDF